MMNKTTKKILKTLFYPAVVVRRRHRNRKLENLKVTDQKAALEYLWRISFKKPFPWGNPQTLNEKITWMCYKTDTSKWTELADKYLMRSHLEKMGLGEYLPKLYGCWDSANDIDFDALPDKFVLKCNHDCGSTVIVDKAGGYNKEKIIAHLNERVSTPFGIDTIEPHYIKIPRKIICEEFIENENKELSSNIIDYKFWCFDGVPRFCFLGLNRSKDDFNADFTLYKVDTWEEHREYMTVNLEHVKQIPRPHNYDKMISLCKKISAGFPQVRVDLYECGSRVFVGEMTFTSQGGRMSYFTDEAQHLLGSYITLPPATR